VPAVKAAAPAIAISVFISSPHDELGGFYLRVVRWLDNDLNQDASHGLVRTK
jgi:hypothetical protein